MCAEYSLRNHIPIAGTGNREPCDGSESPFRVSLGFTPQWFHKRLGIDFSERWHKDPVYRWETLTEMKQYLTNLFPSVENFRPKLEDGVDYGCATLSAAYGAQFYSLIYGQKVIYQKDEWPLVSSQDTLDIDTLLEMPKFDPETNPGFREIIDQVDFLENRWGKAAGYLNIYQGVLNNAFRLCGVDIFMDLIVEPEKVQLLFDQIFDTMLTASQYLEERQRASGFEINQFSSANCVVNMISPDMYEQYILPYDIALSKKFDRYGIHTCNWNATPYFHAMRKIDKMGYLDMGMDSDMQLAQEMFPDARRGVLYSPRMMLFDPIEKITADFEKIRRELGPCDIILADVDAAMPNEKLQEIVRIADAIAERG